MSRRERPLALAVREGVGAEAFVPRNVDRAVGDGGRARRAVQSPAEFGLPPVLARRALEDADDRRRSRIVVDPGRHDDCVVGDGGPARGLVLAAEADALEETARLGLPTGLAGLGVDRVDAAVVGLYVTPAVGDRGGSNCVPEVALPLDGSRRPLEAGEGAVRVADEHAVADERGRAAGVAGQRVLPVDFAGGLLESEQRAALGRPVPVAGQTVRDVDAFAVDDRRARRAGDVVVGLVPEIDSPRLEVGRFGRRVRAAGALVVESVGADARVSRIESPHRPAVGRRFRVGSRWALVLETAGETAGEAAGSGPAECREDLAASHTDRVAGEEYTFC